MSTEAHLSLPSEISDDLAHVDFRSRTRRLVKACEPGLGFTASVTLGSRMPEEEKLDVSRLYSPIHPDDHVQGPADAPYTLVEYGDYQCPGCGRVFTVLRDLQLELANPAPYRIPALSVLRYSPSSTIGR
jgi:hypothetical protein